MVPLVKCLVPIPLLMLSSCAVVPTIEFFVDSNDLTIDEKPRRIACKKQMTMPTGTIC